MKSAPHMEPKQPDFHLTLNPDGTARVIFAITSVIWRDLFFLLMCLSSQSRSTRLFRNP